MQARKETRDIARAVRPQVRTFIPGTKIIPGIRAQALYGHTPGHVMYELASGRDRLLDIGDTAHSSVVSLARPEWSISWDSDKALGARHRTDELKALAASHERMFAVHFPYPGVGRIVRKGEGFAFIPGLPRRSVADPLCGELHELPRADHCPRKKCEDQQQRSASRS